RDRGMPAHTPEPAPHRRRPDAAQPLRGKGCGMSKANDDILCRVDDVDVLYPIRRGFFQRVVGHVRAVEQVSLELRRGETLALVGESGCGRSTLGRASLDLDTPTRGRVTLRSAKAAEGVKLHRGQIAQVVLQNPLASLDPRWRILGNIAEG